MSDHTHHGSIDKRFGTEKGLDIFSRGVEKNFLGEAKWCRETYIAEGQLRVRAAANREDVELVELQVDAAGSRGACSIDGDNLRGRIASLVILGNEEGIAKSR